MPAPKYTDEQKRQALEMVPELGQSETARRLEMPQSTISSWCSRAGVSSNRAEKTRRASETNRADNAARRAVISQRLLQEVETTLGELRGEVTVYAFGGRDNDFSEAQASKPTPRDRQALITCVGIALDKSIALDRFDSDGGQGLAAVDEWLQVALGK